MVALSIKRRLKQVFAFYVALEIIGCPAIKIYAPVIPLISFYGGLVAPEGTP